MQWDSHPWLLLQRHDPLVQPVALELLVERAAADAEQPRRHGLVATRLIQHPRDVVALDSPQGHCKRLRGQWSAGRQRRERIIGGDEQNGRTRLAILANTRAVVSTRL
jgi:hypothetical protein